MLVRGRHTALALGSREADSPSRGQAKGMDPACPHQRGEANLDLPREQVKDGDGARRRRTETAHGDDERDKFEAKDWFVPASPAGCISKRIWLRSEWITPFEIKLKQFTSAYINLNTFQSA